MPRRAAAIEAVYVTLAGVSATGVPPSEATGALGEPVGQVPHRGGELLVTRAGVSATGVTPSESEWRDGRAGLLAAALRRALAGLLRDQPSGQGGAVLRCPLMSGAT